MICKPQNEEILKDMKTIKNVREYTLSDCRNISGINQRTYSSIYHVNQDS